MSKLTVAIAIGTITAIRTTEELWFRTSMDVLEIAAWAGMAYIAGTVATYAAIEKYCRKRKRTTKPSVGTRQIRHRSYRTDDTVFIDAEAIRKIKRKVIRMKGRMSLRIAGTICQQLMEDLGIWEI